MRAKSNLFLFVYAQNSCYVCRKAVTAENLAQYGVEVDLETSTWQLRRRPDEQNKIGKTYNGPRFGGGSNVVIGIFDRTNDDHLDAVIDFAQEIGRGPAGFSD